jgi:signal transduction histidine kinase/DNA-binding response OmpR family regulator/HPt (histidine-containing phosphotransfer) domain-containing protein
MLNFARCSLNRKLTLISGFASGVALLLVFICTALFCINDARERQAAQLASLAGLIGAHNSDALLRNDRAAARKGLAALEGEAGIAGAIVFDRHGKVFARYVPAERADELFSEVDALVPDAAALAEANQHGRALWPRLRVYRAIGEAPPFAGVIMLEADLRAMWLDLARSLGLLGAAMLLALPLAMLLASRIGTTISAPVKQLIAAAAQVARSQDFSVRVAHRRGDEIGALIDGFNAMLAQIEGRGATLSHHRDELERQVGVRTEQLEKAKNAAESASRAKSAFLATMSHEIRTPMNGVLGMTEMLLATRLTEAQRNYTQLVKTSGEHLLVIINDILDFSKIEAGKLSVEYIDFNLWDLLDDISKVYTPQAQHKGIALDFEIDNNIPVAICGDPNRLRQIIANLLGNAIKFTEQGRIRATVRVSTEDGQACALRFEVHDTGIGVAREAKGRIFEAFSQADGSTTRKYGGTGLGLAISRQLVELMGGRIGVDNALKQGSIFWFTVSFDKRRVDPSEPGFSLAAVEGQRVLVVDENATSRDQLAAQLRGWHLDCDSVASSLAAPDMLAAAAEAGRPYDVAIIDMDLARTSGLSLAAAIRADAADTHDASSRALRIVLVSDDRLAADPVQRREAGVSYQLIKPVRPGDLFECVAARARVAAPVSVAAAAAVAVAVTLVPPVIAAASENASVGLPSPSPSPSSGCRVLLAEDNPVNVEVASAMLGSLGLSVHCARNGAEALQAARDGHYDIVLMDCQMPVMDGMAATAEIRRLERDTRSMRSLPIIAITANAMQGDRETCLAAGMDDYLSKPFTQTQLSNLLGRWISLPLAGGAKAADSAPANDPVGPMQPLRRRAPAVEQAQTREVINSHALENIRALSQGHGSALVTRVVSAFISDAPLQLAALRSAVEAADSASMRKIAHSMKSSSANVGAAVLAQMCKEMELLARSGSTEGAAGILADMACEFKAVQDALDTILEKERCDGRTNSQ